MKKKKIDIESFILKKYSERNNSNKKNNTRIKTHSAFNRINNY